MPSPTEITIPQLSRLIGTPATPAIIDVCIDDDFNADPRLRDTRTVVVCQKGKKLSQGAAAVLRAHGVAAETLASGNLAWRDAGEPLVPADRIPPRNAEGRTVWVTRQRPKIDRLACPWLIRRFVDPDALFLFVAPAEVAEVADRFAATPFDVEGVFWSHRGERCTFDTMLDEFALVTEPLGRLAAVVRGADTNRPELAPEAAGLLAASLGISRMYRDDLAALDAGLALYDSFYRWVRDAVDETHDWPAASPGSAAA